METMTIDKAFWDSVEAGRIRPHAAIATLVADGHDEPSASELVFVAIGGSDVVEIGADGVERYPSGKTVAEIERQMII
jgi:hypothetical protein